MLTSMHSPWGELQIARVPPQKNDTLQAFDQADLLVLDHLHEHDLITAEARVLVVNEAFGAVTCALSQWLKKLAAPLPTLWSDSHIAHLGLEHNQQLNDLAQAHFVEAQNAPQGPFNLVIFRLPKSHALLRDQLNRLLPQLAAGALIIMPVMVKHLDTATFALLESLLGKLTTSLARKKARLIFASQYPKSVSIAAEPDRLTWSTSSGLNLEHYSGVFSRTKLDAGAQVLLDNFPDGPFDRVIDLGCGNGVQAIFAARKWPGCQVLGIDQSYMSVASSTINAKHNGVEQQCQFQAGDCLAKLQPKSADLILCNPPFHQERVVGDHIAMRMFKQSAKVLSESGELFVVGNRHLGYHAKLKRWFSQVEQVGVHPKFVVLKAKL